MAQLQVLFPEICKSIEWVCALPGIDSWPLVIQTRVSGWKIDGSHWRLKYGDKIARFKHLFSWRIFVVLHIQDNRIAQMKLLYFSTYQYFSGGNEKVLGPPKSKWCSSTPLIKASDWAQLDNWFWKAESHQPFKNTLQSCRWRVPHTQGIAIIVRRILHSPAARRHFVLDQKTRKIKEFCLHRANNWDIIIGLSSPKIVQNPYAKQAQTTMCSVFPFYLPLTAGILCSIVWHALAKLACNHYWELLGRAQLNSKNTTDLKNNYHFCVVHKCSCAATFPVK